MFCLPFFGNTTWFKTKENILIQYYWFWNIETRKSTTLHKINLGFKEKRLKNEKNGLHITKI